MNLLSNQSKPKKVFFALLAALGLTLIAGGAIFYFADVMLAQKNQSISDLKAEDEILDKKVDNGKKIQNEYSEISNVRDLLKEVLPSTKEQSNLVAELFAIEQKSGANFNSVTFKGSEISDQKVNAALSQTTELESVGNVRILPLSTSDSCISYGQMLNLLKQIEINQRKMQVSNLNINTVNEGTEICPAGNLSITLEIDVYVKV